MELVGATRSETSALVAASAKHSTGCVWMVNDAHAWHTLPDRGQHVLWELYKKLTEYRKELRDDLALILTGQAEPLRRLLYGAPPLAARFNAVIDFPGHTPSQLAAIFSVLAQEAGLVLTVQARRQVAAVLAQAEPEHVPGSARLAVRLLKQVTVTQARRVTTLPGSARPATLGKVIKSDIPQFLEPDNLPEEEAMPGQYL